VHYLVGSAPLEICKFCRSKRLSICQEADEVRPYFGYYAVHRMYYFGYRIHAACIAGKVIKTFGISRASTHDIQYLNAPKTRLHDCVLVRDKG
jgi:hypothetical protein